MDSGDDDGDYTSCGADSKDWEKFERGLIAEGYREGIEEGETRALQKYFDLAQEVIFNNVFRLGQLQGILVFGLFAAKESEFSLTAKEISNDIMAEVRRIKQLRIPEDTGFDEFMKPAEKEMDKRFGHFKDRIIKLDPQYQERIDNLGVGMLFPVLQSGQPVAELVKPAHDREPSNQLSF